MPTTDADLTAAPAWAGLALGTLLIAAPGAGTAAGLGDDRDAIRSAGVVDLVLGLGLRSGRHARGWMVGRMVGNALVASLALRNLARVGPHPGRSAVLAAVLVGLTALDVRILRALRRSRS